MFISVRRWAPDLTITAAHGQDATPPMMMRPAPMIQQRAVQLTSLQRQRPAPMTALQQAAIQMAALQRLPATAARNAMIMTLRRPEVTLTSALRQNLQIADLLRI